MVLFLPGVVGVLLAQFAVRVSPEMIPFLGVAGVVFPLSWVLMTIGTVGAFRSRRWKWGILGLIVFGFSFPQAESTWGWAQTGTVDSEGDGGQRIKVISWNVRQFNRFAWIGAPGVQDSILALMKR